MIYDLIIIGGGMSGISVGHFFRDQNILILEKGNLLSEASGKNAGFIISGFGEHFIRTANRWGIDRACEIQKIHLANHERLRNLAVQFDCDYKRSGSLAVGLTKDEQSDLAQSYDLLKQEGFSVEWLDRVAIGMKEPCSALLNQSDGSMDPVKFWRKVAEGLPVQSHCEVLSVTRQKDFLAVETTSGNFKARRVVYCLNAFAESLLPVMKGRYIPLRGQIIELPLQGKSPTERPIYAKYGDLYWRFTTNSFIFGGLEDAVPDQEVGIAKEVSPQILDAQVRWIQENFEDHLIEFSPQTWKPRCSTMAFTVDGFPFVGHLAEKDCYVLSGLCGLGHGYAMECASWLYDLIEPGINKIPAYISSDRMNILPVYTGGDWRNLYEAWNHGIH